MLRLSVLGSPGRGHLVSEALIQPQLCLPLLPCPGVWLHTQQVASLLSQDIITSHDERACVAAFLPTRQDSSGLISCTLAAGTTSIYGQETSRNIGEMGGIGRELRESKRV